MNRSTFIYVARLTPLPILSISKLKSPILSSKTGLGLPLERYALDVDEAGPPSSDLPSEKQIWDQLGQETLVIGRLLS
jgi:hypothetical protein